MLSCFIKGVASSKSQAEIFISFASHSEIFDQKNERAMGGLSKFRGCWGNTHLGVCVYSGVKHNIALSLYVFITQKREI
jgi:hypothetical protein